MVLSGDGMRRDTADAKRVERSVHTQMSEMESVLSVRALLRTAADWGWKAVAVTDHGVVQAFRNEFALCDFRVTKTLDHNTSKFPCPMFPLCFDFV